MTALPAWVRDGDEGAILAIKAVPGARQDQIVGPLGDRLKVRTSAPPEAGKANRAIIALLARSLRVKPRDLSIESGATSPDKTIVVRGISAMDAATLLA